MTATRKHMLGAGARRLLVVLVVVVCGVLGRGAGAAFAASPGWLVSTEAIPTLVRPGSSELLVVHLANIGGASTDGSPVVVRDTLPAGMEATQAGEIANEQGTIISGTRWVCVGRTVVTCENSAANQPAIAPTDGFKNLSNLEVPAEAPEIGIRATVPAGVSGTSENVVRVAGGGTGWPALAREPVTISSEEPKFGIAGFSVSSYNEDGSSDAEASSHPYGLTVALQMNSWLNPEGQVIASDDAKTFEAQAPAGLVGDPQSVTECSREAFDGATVQGAYPTCPVSSQVGVVLASFGNQGQLLPEYFLLPVYNLLPPPGVPAQFGFSEQGIYGTLDASLRTGGDYGLTETVKNAAQRSLINAVVTLWGVPSDPAHDAQRIDESEPCGQTRPRTCASGLSRLPFLTNPAQCATTMNWTLSTTDWLEPGTPPPPATTATVDNLDQPAVVDGCEHPAFEPSVTATADETEAGSPTGLHVDVHVPQHYQNPETPAEATVQNATIRLPAGLTISPSAADGLEACTESQIGLSNSQQPSCPEAAKLGTVEIKTPLLAEPLQGAVYLAQQDQNPFGSLLAIYIAAEGSGALVKLAGKVEANAQTGQLTTTVTNAPDLPFEDVKLDLFDGPRAALMTPSACGSYTTESALAPWTGTATVSSNSAPFNISSGCDTGFSPSFLAGSSTQTAGAFTNLNTTISRTDSEATIQNVSVQLPPGLLGVLKGVQLCPEVAAAQGQCGPASEIATTTVAAGPGPDPLYLKGNVFLTGPYQGAPFGLSILVPAIAGPFDLGNVVVRARIEIDPHTAQITVTTDPLPQMVNSIEGLQSGIPTDLRLLNVSVNRPGFIFNPTRCTPMSINSTITPTTGNPANAASPFQVANCSTLPFKPVFTASTSGKTSKADGASLEAKIVYPTTTPGASQASSQSNIASVKVDLPKQLPSRLTTLQKACLAKVFETNPANCPAESVIGHATATTPVLPVPVSGPAYFVSHGGEAFPSLILVLQGYGIKIELIGTTNIGKTGITSSTFKQIPDVPITSFTLTLPEQKYSALTTNLPANANRSLCGQNLAMPTALTGQNGAVIHESTKIAINGCPKRKTTKKKKQATQKQAKGEKKKKR